jgi:hypothetical protein
MKKGTRKYWIWDCRHVNQGNDSRDDSACPAVGRKSQDKTTVAARAAAHKRKTGHIVHMWSFYE